MFCIFLSCKNVLLCVKIGAGYLLDSCHPNCSVDGSLGLSCDILPLFPPGPWCHISQLQHQDQMVLHMLWWRHPVLNTCECLCLLCWKISSAYIRNAEHTKDSEQWFNLVCLVMCFQHYVNNSFLFSCICGLKRNAYFTPNICSIWERSWKFFFISVADYM